MEGFGLEAPMPSPFTSPESMRIEAIPTPPPLMEGFGLEAPMPSPFASPESMRIEAIPTPPMAMPDLFNTFSEDTEPEDEAIIDYASFYESFITTNNARREQEAQQGVENLIPINEENIFEKLLTTETPDENIRNEANTTDTADIFSNMISQNNSPAESINTSIQNANITTLPSLENVPVSADMFERSLPAFQEMNVEQIMPLSTADMPDLSNFNISESMFDQMKTASTTLGIESNNAPMNFGLENMLIKNQENNAPSLADAFTSVQKMETPNASEMMANADVMMNDVNLEPIGDKIESSIQGLSTTLTNQNQASTQTPASPSSTLTPDVTNELLTLLRKMDATLSNIPNMATSSQGSIKSFGGGGLNETNARIIGRQIANELKDSLARLYN